MTRTGPGKQLSGRLALPAPRPAGPRASRSIENWRLIQDPDGAQGWMLVTLLSDRRTAIVKPGEPRPIRTRAERRREGSLQCRARRRRPHRQMHGDGWCRIEIGKREGYIRTSDLWGVSESEVVD